MNTHNSADAVIYSVADGERNLVYEITVGHVRVWDVADPSTEIAGADSAYLNYSNIHEVQIADNKGVLWLAHIDYKVVRIKLSGTTLTVDQPTFTGGTTFSETGDYPTAIGFTGGRLALGFTRNLPNAIFLSRSPDLSNIEESERYTDFTYYDEEEGGATTIETSHAIELEDSELVRGYWFLNQTRFLIGSGKSIFMDSGGLITPASFDISPALREGSAMIKAKGLKNYIVFTGVSGKTLTMMVYNRDSEGYQSKELTSDSSHLFAPGIKDFVILFMPDPMVWVLLNDGSILSCTVDTSTGTLLTGWAKHPMGGRRIETISYGQKYDGRDSLYLTSSVEVNGVRKYHIEVLDMDDIFDSEESFVYLDSAVVKHFDTPTESFLYNADYAGTKVSVFADECVLPDVIVADDGTVTLDRKVTDVTVGIPYESIAGFLSRELPNNGESSFGNKRRLKKTTLRMYESLGGYIGTQYEDTTAMYKILSASYGDLRYGVPVHLTSEDFATDIQSRNMTNATIYVKTDYPTPLNILALKEKIELLET